MSVRIELLGPSGVGKSTILRAAEQLRADQPEWVGPHEVDQLLQNVPQRSRTAISQAAIDNTEHREFINYCFSVTATSSMLPSQRLTAIKILQNSCYRSSVLADAQSGTVIVDDESILHRAFSLLLHSANVGREAATYFELAPTPDAAVILIATEGEILSRIHARGTIPNCYVGLDGAGLRHTIADGIAVARVAADVLSSRGVAVKTLETSHDLQRNARELHRFCTASRLDEPA